jgi:hypothetical protein
MHEFSASHRWTAVLVQIFEMMSLMLEIQRRDSKKRVNKLKPELTFDLSPSLKTRIGHMLRFTAILFQEYKEVHPLISQQNMEFLGVMQFLFFQASLHV